MSSTYLIARKQILLQPFFLEKVGLWNDTPLCRPPPPPQMTNWCNNYLCCRWYKSCSVLHCVSSNDQPCMLPASTSHRPGTEPCPRGMRDASAGGHGWRRKHCMSVKSSTCTLNHSSCDEGQSRCPFSATWIPCATAGDYKRCQKPGFVWKLRCGVDKKRITTRHRGLKQERHQGLVEAILGKGSRPHCKPNYF